MSGDQIGLFRRRPATDGYIEGERLKTVGMDKAASKTAIGKWKIAFHNEVVRQAASGRLFTSEDITERIGMPEGAGTAGNNAVGALMNAAARKEIIQKVGYAPAKRSSRHAAIIATWRGK